MARAAPEPLVPLAYVRRLVIAPVLLATAPDPPEPEAPPVVDKRRYTRWQARHRARADLIRLRTGVVAAASDALIMHAGRVSGLKVVPWPAETISRQAPVGSIAARPEVAIAFARQAGADAVLATAVDRFGAHTGLEREIWTRIVAYVVSESEPAVRGPYYSFGRARAGHSLFHGGFQKPDALLERDAAEQAARRLCHVLETGEEMPLARNCRVAVIPAAVPPFAEKWIEGMPRPAQDDEAQPAKQRLVRVLVPELERQRDVLLQLDLSPTAEIIDADDVKDAVVAMGLRPGDCWTADGRPDVAVLRHLADTLHADGVFLSRITDAQLTEYPIAVQDAGRVRAGLERQAEVEVEAALFQTRDGQLLWSDRPMGGTVARTEYVRHQPRLRSDAQCLIDAARTAYAYLRFSFDEYERKFER